MKRARFAIVVLLGLVFTVPGYSQNLGRSYTLTPYDVPHTTGNNTSLFDLAKGGRVVIGTYFTNRQNAFGISQKKGTLTSYTLAAVSSILLSLSVRLGSSAVPTPPMGSELGRYGPVSLRLGYGRKLSALPFPFPP